MLEVPVDELTAAVRRRDEVETARVAERMGPSGLTEALRRSEGPALLAALAGVSSLRGGVRLLGTVTELLGTVDSGALAPVIRTIGDLLATTSPPELDEWEVPPDVVSGACVTLRSHALETHHPTPVRVAALDALGDAVHVCTATAELVALLRDPSPAVRRAAALVVRPTERLATGGFPVGLRDVDRSVAAASAASMCELFSLPVMAGRGGGREPIWDNARDSARRLVLLPETPAEDAVQMLDCLDPTSGKDRALLETVKSRAHGAIQNRAAELLGEPRASRP